MDLESITIAVKRNKLLKMILKLYIHTVKLPIQEFHSIIVRREELQRIRRITTPIRQSCLSARVAATIQSERPADRPVLAGLIREETEKTTATLRQQLKSATDQLEYVRQQQEQIMHSYNHKLSTNNHSNNRSRKPKNVKGGNNNNNKVHTGSAGNGNSTVAAATSISAPITTLTTARKPPPQPQSTPGWGRNRQRPIQTTGPSSVDPVENAITVHKRKGDKSWSRSKSKRNKQS
jgi:hypothetical protein